MLDIYTSFICNAGICYLGITVYSDIHVLPKLGDIRYRARSVINRSRKILNCLEVCKGVACH